jgi:multimeric flavodoxin WrbA
MKIRKITDKKYKILLFQGSSRDKDTCPGMESKTQKVLDYVVDKWSPFFEFDVVDLSINHKKRPIIQPCKGCVSTSSYHCHWKCSCFKPNDSKKPDLMHDDDIYGRLENNDGFVVFSPIHWHAPTTQVKALFDRLVCANMTLTTTDALSVLGKGNLKNAEITGKMSLEGEYDDLLKNHLEGKVGGFYIHGDMGADDYSSSEKPETFSQKDENKWFGDAKSTIMPIVFQCRYSGIEVPDKLVQAFYTNKGEPYYQSNIEFDENKDFFDKADQLMENLLEHLEKKES